MLPKKLHKLHEQMVIGMSKLVAVLCPDEQTAALARAVYAEARAADAACWSTVSLLIVVVDWQTDGLPDPAYSHCLGTVNYRTDALWCEGQVRPKLQWSDDVDPKAMLFEARLFGITQDEPTA